MAKFMYHARDGGGTLATGVVNAPTIEDAGRILRSEGKFIVRISPAAKAGSDESAVAAASANGSVKRRDVIFFAHQLSVMIDTGVPLSDSLECAADQAEDETMKVVLKDVMAHVRSGGEFSGALQKYPKVFPSVMISLVRAGEMSGTMGRMLDRASAYLTKEEKTMKQAKGALTYPCFMMFAAISVTVFLLTFVLPKFAAIYANRGATLPAPTRFLIGLSNGLVDYWLFWATLAMAAFVGVVVMGSTLAGRRMIDWCKLNIPVANTLFTQLYITRSTRTMGTLIDAGVSMLDMIAIIKQVTNNVFFADLWDEVDERLRQGSQLSEPLFASALVPRSVTQMVYSGEKSGQLGKVLAKIADFTEDEFDQAVKNTTQFIEPVMVGAMGGMIGFVAISLLLPIFSVGSVVSGG